jgi:hypothetical protein
MKIASHETGVFGPKPNSADWNDIIFCSGVTATRDSAAIAAPSTK